ncbi:hypothetical protein M9H77_35358 [Catharanthus roseus]|uniref:Uncharacterized protein n=1 Tax=Catharanthus roseus TaxID=4058 RepID=A0ACB9ZP34_CATRO|nr:hypothetical protein M9H77_35358 [Catharanthus roseus]
MAMSTGFSQSSSTTNPPSKITFRSLLECWCGIPAPILTSKTSKNKGRKFFGCGNFKMIVVDTPSNKVDNLPNGIQMEEDIAILKVDSAKLKNYIKEVKKRMDSHVQNSGQKKLMALLYACFFFMFPILLIKCNKLSVQDV